MTKDDSSISKTAFSFVTLREVKSKGEGKSVDFIGIVLSASEVASVSIKSGGTKDKRDFEIMDDSEDGGIKTRVTLWGLPAKKFAFKPGTIVAFKGLRISQFRGITLNGGDYTGVYEGSGLKEKRVQELTKYYRAVGSNLDSVKSLTETDEGEKRAVNSNVRLIKEINTMAERDLVNNPMVRYYLNGHVEMIRNDPRMVYMACPS